MKVGGDAVYRTFNGVSRSMPVDVARVDGSLAEQIAFSGPGLLSAHDLEAGVFIQDHWAIGDRFALDAGLRFSGQTLGMDGGHFAATGFRICPRQKQPDDFARRRWAFLCRRAASGRELYRQP